MAGSVSSSDNNGDANGENEAPVVQLRGSSDLATTVDHVEDGIGKLPLLFWVAYMMSNINTQCPLINIHLLFCS